MVRAVAVRVGSGRPAMFGNGVVVGIAWLRPMFTTRGVAVAVVVGSLVTVAAGGVSIAAATVAASKRPIGSSVAAIWVPSASASAGAPPSAGMMTSR